MDGIVEKKREWMLANGDIVTSTEITVGSATAEYVEIDGERVCVNADIAVKTGEWSTVTFYLWGLHDPQLRVCHASLTTRNEFLSSRDAPVMFDREFKKYLKRDEFRTEPGKLFLNRIGDCLNYTWRL